MTRKGGAPRCPVCGWPTGQGECRGGHGAPRSLHAGEPVTPGRGLPPLDLLRGVTEVVRAFFTIILGRPFVGLLGRPVAVNAIAFVALGAGFWFGLMPAYEGTTQDPQELAFWALASWLLLAPLWLEAVAGPAQRSLRATVVHVMLGLPPEPPPPPPRLRDRAIFVVTAAVMLPVGLAITLIPWVGLPVLALLGAAVAAVVWFDTPLSEAGYDLRARMAVLWRNRWRALGVGTALQFATAVPFVNLLLLPSLAAVSVTSAFVRFDKRTASVGAPK